MVNHLLFNEIESYKIKRFVWYVAVAVFRSFNLSLLTTNKLVYGEHKISSRIPLKPAELIKFHELGS